MARKTLTVRLTPTARTDLLCILCGHFRAELEIAPAAGEEPHAGVHARCARKRRPPSDTPETGGA